jgi:hypothetical protein
MVSVGFGGSVTAAGGAGVLELLAWLEACFSTGSSVVGLFAGAAGGPGAGGCCGSCC